MQCGVCDSHTAGLEDLQKPIGTCTKIHRSRLEHAPKYTEADWNMHQYTQKSTGTCTKQHSRSYVFVLNGTMALISRKNETQHYRCNTARTVCTSTQMMQTIPYIGWECRWFNTCVFMRLAGSTRFQAITKSGGVLFHAKPFTLHPSP